MFLTKCQESGCGDEEKRLEKMKKGINVEISAEGLFCPYDSKFLMIYGVLGLVFALSCWYYLEGIFDGVGSGR